MLEALKSLFVSEAWAMGTAPGGEGGGGGSFIGSLLPFILIFVIFYFLLIRPQQKRAKEQKDMLGSLKRGDKVITQGGIYGLIEDVDEKTVTLKIAENVKVKFGKAYVAALRTPSDES